MESEFEKQIKLLRDIWLPAWRERFCEIFGKEKIDKLSDECIHDLIKVYARTCEDD